MSKVTKFLALPLSALLALGAAVPAMSATKLGHYSSAKSLTAQLKTNKAIKCAKPTISKSPYLQNQIMFTCEDDTTGFWFPSAAAMKPFLADQKTKLNAGDTLIYGDNWWVTSWGGGKSNPHNVAVVKALTGTFYIAPVSN
jgi:hypothetical protein